jgi:hypothetical protein
VAILSLKQGYYAGWIDGPRVYPSAGYIGRTPDHRGFAALGEKGNDLSSVVSLVNSTALVLMFMLFMYMIHGGLEWLFRTSPLRLSGTAVSWDTVD